MAWLNPTRKFDEYNCLAFSSSYLANISDTLYNSSAFDLSTGDLITVPANTVLRVGDEHVVLQIDNTFAGGRLSHLSIFVDNVEVNYIYSGSLMTEFKICMAVNEGSGSSYIGLYSTNWNQCQIKWFNSGITEYLRPYTASIYIWESISSILGKGNTYRLTDILNINDGEAVNDVQASGNVDFSAKSKVNNLISAVMDKDLTKVIVTYIIPSGTYSYIKLVYKQGSIPSNYNDGTAINITQSSTSQVIEGIVDGNTYWFVIRICPYHLEQNI